MTVGDLRKALDGMSEDGDVWVCTHEGTFHEIVGVEVLLQEGADVATLDLGEESLFERVEQPL